MTLFAVVSGVAAAVFWVQATVRGAEVVELRERVDRLERQGERRAVEVEGLEWQRDELSGQIEDLRRSLETAKERGLGLPSCLGLESDGGARLLLRVTVNRGYLLEQLWRSGDSEEGLPSLLTEQPAEALSPFEFSGRGKMIYDYGVRTDTFGGRCRFYVELKRGPAVSRLDYLDARLLVENYFSFGNSTEVTRESMRRE